MSRVTSLGSLADDPLWISSVAGIPREELASDLDKLAERRRADKLVFTRWALVMYRFEQELYADPDREDLNALWWDLVEKAGRYLQEAIFGQGARDNWEDTVLRATGERLDPAYFVETLR